MRLLIRWICRVCSVALIMQDVLCCVYYAGCAMLRSLCRVCSVALILQGVFCCAHYARCVLLHLLCRVWSVALIMQGVICCAHYAGCVPLRSLCRVCSVALLSQPCTGRPFPYNWLSLLCFSSLHGLASLYHSQHGSAAALAAQGVHCWCSLLRHTEATADLALATRGSVNASDLPVLPN